MTKKEMILEAIEGLGYKPHVDDDGDICVRFQMKSIFFLTGQEEEQYISAILPQFSEVNEGEGSERRRGNPHTGCLQQGES